MSPSETSSTDRPDQHATDGSHTNTPLPLRWALSLAFGATAAMLIWGLGVALAESFQQEGDRPLDRLRPQLLINEPAPDFTLTDHQGRQHRLSELEGRPVVLNFWSMACPPCRQEMPSLIRLSEIARRQGGFWVVTVTVESSWEEVQELFGTETPPLTVLFDPDRRVVESTYGTERFPETFLIDSAGNVRARFDGARDWSSPDVLEVLAGL